MGPRIYLWLTRGAIALPQCQGLQLARRNPQTPAAEERRAPLDGHATPLGRANGPGSVLHVYRRRSDIAGLDALADRATQVPDSA